MLDGTQIRESTARVAIHTDSRRLPGGGFMGTNKSTATANTATNRPPKPVHIPAAMSAAWTGAFGDVTCPAYVVGIATLVNRAYRSVPAAERATATFDTWAAALRSADKSAAPNGPAHRFTNGSGRDIARTQNVIYVACAVSGIAAADITNAFGMAMWDHIINATNTCKYATKSYWRSTMADFVNGRHNDAFTLPVDVAARAVRLWRDAKPGDAPTGDAPTGDAPTTDAPTTDAPTVES